jgi:hypothetical protein
MKITDRHVTVPFGDKGLRNYFSNKFSRSHIAAQLLDADEVESSIEEIVKKSNPTSLRYG